jgi:gluconate 5-dehydrogenase
VAAPNQCCSYLRKLSSERRPHVIPKRTLRENGAEGLIAKIKSGWGCRMATSNQLFALEGRIALVTGASRGLGLSIAEGLAEAGATVLLNGRKASSLDTVVSTLRERGLKAEKSAFDVTDIHAVNNAIDAVLARHGRIDILIANAGINHRAPLDDWTLSDWDRVLATNLKSCFILAQHAAKSMRQQRRGRIIFTTSIASILARSGIHGYAASKSGLVGLTRSLACELGEHGITCNGICPGYFETELTSSYLHSEEYVRRLNDRVPLRRWGTPRDLTGAAIFLASDAASYVTGQQIVIDGGFTITI